MSDVCMCVLSSSIVLQMYQTKETKTSKSDVCHWWLSTWNVCLIDKIYAQRHPSRYDTHDNSIIKQKRNEYTKMK